MVYFVCLIHGLIEIRSFLGYASPLIVKGASPRIRTGTVLGTLLYMYYSPWRGYRCLLFGCLSKISPIDPGAFLPGLDALVYPLGLEQKIIFRLCILDQRYVICYKIKYLKHMEHNLCTEYTYS